MGTEPGSPRPIGPDELDFEVPVLGVDGKTTADYLWFVGCAGSFDDRNTAVSVALARLLHRAGIDFAILGQQELCNGDPARRSGNEVRVPAAGSSEHCHFLGVFR